MEIYQGGLASSFELVYAQVATRITRIDAVRIKAELLRSSIDLIRASLDGRSNRRPLPSNDQIQPFGTFPHTNLDKPPPASLYVPIRRSRPRPSEAE